MCRKFWTVAVTLYWPQDIVPLGTALPLSLEFLEWFPVLCALVLWSFLTSASQITNIPNNSVCLLSTLAKQMVTQAELAGVELSKEVGKGEILVGFFCCSGFLWAATEMWEMKFWTESETEGYFIWKNIFVLHLYKIFPILVSQNF